MASLGAAYYFWWPGSFNELSASPFVYFASTTSADNTSVTLTTITPTAGGITICFIDASYEAAADTGTLSVSGANASIRDQGILATLAAGTNKILETSMPLRWLNADGAVSITLGAGGTLTGNITVAYIIQGNG